MSFNHCYNLIQDKFLTMNFSGDVIDFSALVYITGDEGGYIYISFTNGEKFIEPVKHDSANIFVSLSPEILEAVYTRQLDPVKAFTTGQIKAKGNVSLGFYLLKKLNS